MIRVVLIYAILLMATEHWSDVHVAVLYFKDTLESLGLMFGLPVLSLWFDEWLTNGI